MLMRKENVLCVEAQLDNTLVHSRDAEAAVRESMIRQISHVLVNTRMQERRAVYTTTYSVRLYVFTADEFAQAVREEALRYSMYSSLIQP